ncbi:PLAC8-like protein 1 [Marmota monax]|uniref:PLAC8 like 1 n=1 Tax=Marmota marmota marmota TaxID=9994 RepID=A0A8C5ZWH0_MARMA|nr:PLAC8-like protein 1 [Marmota marmota marmota]XP_046316183.1 PLAC8-like protein 1 [Marmota monax]KAI6056736.1 PLAC8L1 [Marmota monax]KAI6070467.1 PLAC8L1 [Marmota monax]
MNWFGHYFSKCPKDVSLLNVPSPLLFSLISSEDEHFISNLRSHVPVHAVVKQPVRGASGRTTITAIAQTGGDWSTGLFSVCRDRRICFCGLFCPLCLECDIARNYGECPCWPLLPGSTFALRIGIRERHKIQGTLCEDWLVVHCCWPFSICQVARELKMRTSQLYEICAVPSTKDTLV